MSIQKLPLAALQQVRQYIKSTITLTDVDQKFQDWAMLDDFDDLPEPASVDNLSSIFAFGSLSPEQLHCHGSWVVSTVNPGAALVKLPGISLKPGMRLVGYVYQFKDDGLGAVWAVPKQFSTTFALENAIASKEASQPPQPEGALGHFMEAIRGDRSAVSFVVASLLRRGLEEFGKLGQRCHWGHHQLIDAVPGQAEWQWKHQQPTDMAPKVKIMPDGQAAVEFFTWRTTHPIALFRHIELYPAETYVSRSQNQTIATPHRSEAIAQPKVWHS
ncbi:MAG: hypothetical protein KME11_14485 [Timaviella obliquedivisa GSE-PSE-MK23-08B]|jgi:hypothetical protein|nr:hypothetical protein [Timaviella obliquedivisa GSE-PSE-MK23-08B]